MNKITNKIIKIKELTNIKFSLKKTKYDARWYNTKTSSEIIIYLPFFKNRRFDDLVEHISYILLGEFLCSSVFSGNRIKKECAVKSGRCLPFCIAFLIKSLKLMKSAERATKNYVSLNELINIIAEVKL